MKDWKAAKKEKSALVRRGCVPGRDRGARRVIVLLTSGTVIPVWKNLPAT